MHHTRLEYREELPPPFLTRVIPPIDPAYWADRRAYMVKVERGGGEGIDPSIYHVHITFFYRLRVVSVRAECPTFRSSLFTSSDHSTDDAFMTFVSTHMSRDSRQKASGDSHCGSHDRRRKKNQCGFIQAESFNSSERENIALFIHSKVKAFATPLVYSRRALPRSLVRVFSQVYTLLLLLRSMHNNLLC